MADLTTRYMGLKLAHPIVASASPLAATANGVRELEKHGAAAVVLPSLFEEQIHQERVALETQLTVSAHTSPEASHYFMESENYNDIASQYLDLVRDAANECSIPVIASINGASESGWVDIAKDIQAAGADISRWLAAGRLKPRIDRVLPLEQTALAHKLQEESTIGKSGALAGKIVIRP